MYPVSSVFLTGYFVKPLQVGDIIQDGLVKQTQMSKWSLLRTPTNQVIALGPNTDYFAQQIIAVKSARRLKELSNCITHIFENRINDAKKVREREWRDLLILIEFVFSYNRR